MRKIQHIIEYILLRFLLFIFNSLPYESGLKFSGAVVLGIGHLVGGSYKRRLRETLRFAFPENTPERNEEIIRNTFRSVGYLAFEFARFGMADRNWFDKYCEIEESSFKAMKKAHEAGNGMILIAAHLGNWEILNHVLIERLGLDFNVYAAPQSNPYADNFVFRSREKTGIKLILPSASGIQAVRALKRGGTLGLVSDQNARGHGLFIPFMNRPASIFQGPASFAYNSGSPSFFITALRTGNGHFRIEAVPVGTIEKDKVNDPEQAMADFTLRWVDLLEKYVRKYPDQYFWLHNRWKTKTGPGQKILERKESGLNPL